MDPIASYLVVSLPQSTDSVDYLHHVAGEGGSHSASVYRFPLQDFQIGTLDSLVHDSEDLAKLDQQLAASVTKIVEIMGSVVSPKTTASSSSPPSLSAAGLAVQAKPACSYLENFAWNSIKYRVDKPINQLIETIASEAIALDNDVKQAYTNYQLAKSNYVAADRKRNGDLSIKSLHDIVKPEHFVSNLEHLTSVIVAVPRLLVLDFKQLYETLTEFVIPRLATVVATDNEYTLYTVTLFKKFQQEYINACREHKWHPRTDFLTYLEDHLNEMRKEFDQTRQTEAKARNDLVRLVKTAYSDVFLAWIHIKAIQVYVESVLRYGLPPLFECLLIKFGSKTALAKVKKELVHKFGYLGGEAFHKDSNSAALNEYASLVDSEYEPFVLYELDVL